MKRRAELPEDVIHHIFCHLNLTNQEAIRLSLASKQFLGFVQQRPNLNFGLSDEGNSYDQRMNRPGEELKYLNSTLDRYLRQDIQLQSFTLKAGCSDGCGGDSYNRCIKSAAESPGLKNLNISKDRSLSDILLPQAVFKIKSLVELKLRSFLLKPERVVVWPNLKRLSLTHGCVATKEALESIIRGCPLIENLELHTCLDPNLLPQAVFEMESLVELELVGFVLKPERLVVWPNLKRLSLTRRCVATKEVTEAIIIGCPLIESLELGTLFRSTFDLDLSNLRNFKKIKISVRNQCLEVITTPNLESIHCSSNCLVDIGNAEYPNLKTLTVEAESMDDYFFIDFARRFAKLRKLTLKCSLTSQVINLSSASLEEIELVVKVGTSEETAFLDFDVPNLVHFEYTCSRLKECRLPVLSFSGNSDGWRSSSIKIDARYKTVDTSFFEELNQTLFALNSAQTSITLTFEGNKVLLNHEELARSATLVRGIREFSLDAVSYGSSANAILDYIFLICRPRIITLPHFMSTNEDLMRIHEELISRSGQDRLRVTLGMPQSSATFEDWDKFLEVWRTVENKWGTKNISFHLEYSS